MSPRGGGLPPVRPSDRWTIWARHDKVLARGVNVWVPLITGLACEAAVVELTTRQDRVRRSGEPCRLVMLPDGKVPQ